MAHLLRLPIPRHLVALTSLFLLMKLQTDTINTMPLVRRRRVPFALENMSQMSAAVTAHNLRPLHAERTVRVPRHRAGDAVKVRGPAASRLELVVCLVQGRVAPGAGVHSGRGHVFVIFAREGGFGAFFA